MQEKKPRCLTGQKDHRTPFLGSNRVQEYLTKDKMRIQSENFLQSSNKFPSNVTSLANCQVYFRS